MSSYHTTSRILDRVAGFFTECATTPAKLYHGTPGRNAPDIIASGIVPGIANFKGISKPDSVYLTNSEDSAADWVYNAYVECRGGSGW